MKKTKKMNAGQKDYLKSVTCNILERYSELEDNLKAHGIPKKHVKKIGKALDLIFEVNQACLKKNS